MGAGSVGSLFGGLIANTGQEVILIGRKQHIQAIKNNKLKIKGLHKKEIEIPAVESPNEAKLILDEKKTIPKIVLITTKAHQTAFAVEQLKEIISKQTILLSIQNGIGTEEIIRSAFPNNIVLRGITSIGVSKPESGVINFTGEGITLIGFQNEGEQKYAENIVKIMRKSKINTKLESNILGAVFSKTIVNCGLNPIAALYQVKNIEVINRKHLRKKAIDLAQEAWNVARELDIKLFVENPIDFMIDIIKKTGDNTNSMLVDVLNKRKTEIDFINGKIVEFGIELGIDVSNNKEIYNKIIELTNGFH
jgi:2-dehydropantoate 2-reductase